MEIKKSGNTVLDLLNFITDSTMSLAKENSVLGAPVEKDGFTVIPVSKMSVSFAGGGADMHDAKRGRRQSPSGGGAKVDYEPLSFLVIKDGTVEIVNLNIPSKSFESQIIDTVIDTAKKLFNKKEKE